VIDGLNPLDGAAGIVGRCEIPYNILKPRPWITDSNLFQAREITAGPHEALEIGFAVRKEAFDDCPA
jgi:hypothetical protein